MEGTSPASFISARRDSRLRRETSRVRRHGRAISLAVPSPAHRHPAMSRETRHGRTPAFLSGVASTISPRSHAGSPGVQGTTLRWRRGRDDCRPDGATTHRAGPRWPRCDAGRRCRSSQCNGRSASGDRYRRRTDPSARRLGARLLGTMSFATHGELAPLAPGGLFSWREPNRRRRGLASGPWSTPMAWRPAMSGPPCPQSP